MNVSRTRRITTLMLAPAMAWGLAATAPAAWASPINLLSNPGFEGGVYTQSNATNIPDAWTQVQSRNSGRSDAVTAHTGTYTASMKSPTSTSSFIQLTQTVPVTAGQTYTGSVWLLNPTSAPLASGYEAYVTLNFNGGGDGHTNGFSGNYDSTNLTAGQWTLLNFTGAAGTNGTQVTVTLTMKAVGNGTHASGDNRIVYWDDANLHLVPEPASLALLGLGGLMMLSRRRREG